MKNKGQRALRTTKPIGLDDRWGTLSVSNLTDAAIRAAAGNMGYATNAVWVGNSTTETAETQSYAYDNAGCLTNLNGTRLEWDERYMLGNVDGRLLSEDSITCAVEYAYDVLGRRTTRIENGTTNYYVYNGNQIIADLAEDGSLLRSYAWGTGIDNLLCMTVYESGEGVASTNTYYAVKDHQNTVLALVDEFGTVAESYEYDAYGSILDVQDGEGHSIGNQQSEIGNRYTFQGREIDWLTGLIYFRARWYDPDSGRWLSKDLIGISGGLNQYEFCQSNPVNFVDPMGLDGYSSTEADIGSAGMGVLLGFAAAALYTGPVGLAVVFGFGVGLAFTFAVLKVGDLMDLNRDDDEGDGCEGSKVRDIAAPPVPG
jgi:RHS repeat-associated protein